jgi:DNA-binding NtrC family response regulator
MQHTCLILEDSQIQARVIASMFKGLGWNTLVAFNMRSALFTLDQQHVDMCLSDLILPDDPEMTAIRALKAAQPGIIVAAMTAGGGQHKLRDALIQAKADGAEFLLPKPFNEDRLTPVLDEVEFRLIHNRRRPQIMVIDEARTVRSYCRKALEDAGYRVVEADSLDRARAQVDVLDLSAIVCDLSMRGLPVLEHLPKVREQLPGVGIVSMSGTDAKDSALRKALQGGADVALSKPFSPTDLVSAVRKAQILAASQLLELVRDVA